MRRYDTVAYSAIHSLRQTLQHITSITNPPERKGTGSNTASSTETNSEGDEESMDEKARSEEDETGDFFVRYCNPSYVRKGVNYGV